MSAIKDDTERAFEHVQGVAGSASHTMQDPGPTQLAQLQQLLHSSEQLADSLGFTDLAANQKFWYLRVLQVVQQQQQDSIQQLLQHGAPCACRQHNNGAAAVVGCSCPASESAVSVKTHKAPSDAALQQAPEQAVPCSISLAQQDGERSGSGSPASSIGKQAAFKAKFPLTLERPLHPFLNGLLHSAQQQSKVSPQQQQQEQQQHQHQQQVGPQQQPQSLLWQQARHQNNQQQQHTQEQLSEQVQEQHVQAGQAQQDHQQQGKAAQRQSQHQQHLNPKKACSPQQQQGSAPQQQQQRQHEADQHTGLQQQQLPKRRKIQQYQEQQQQQVGNGLQVQQQQHLLQQVDAQANVQRRVPSRFAVNAGVQAGKQQQQQQGQPTLTPATADAQSPGDVSGQHTSLLDTLAIAAAAAMDDPSSIEQQPASTYMPVAEAVHADAAAATARQAPSVLAAAGSSSEQVLMQATYNVPAPVPVPRPAAAAAVPARAAARSAPARAAAVSSPSGSSGSGSRDPTSSTITSIAAEAGQGGGRHTKSALLDLADQIGAAAVATAQAAAEAGEPMSYDAVMQLLRPLEARVAEDVGAPLEKVKGIELDAVRRAFYFNQGHAAKSFGMGATKFKALLRSLAVRYWPHRQFLSIVEALNFLKDKSLDSRDGGDVPGRMLVLHHAWYMLNKHPNMVLDNHPAAAIKKAIHKQSFKERQKDAQAAKQLMQQATQIKNKAKRLVAQMEASPAAAVGTSAPAAAVATAAAWQAAGAAAAAAAVAAPADGDAQQQYGPALPDEVVSQVYEALAVWPDFLEYLAAEATEVLMLPIAQR